MFKTRVYRLIEEIGRWSMVDPFVIACFVPVMQYNALIYGRAEPAAPAFATVVVLTMIAARAFDPRLMWDVAMRPGHASRRVGLTTPETSAADEAAVQPRTLARESHGRWPGLVWALPLAAVLIVVYLGLQALAHSGVDVVVTFSSAADAKPGDTQVVYKGLNVGRVTHLGLSKDRQHVDMTLRVDPSLKPLLREGAVFWLVGRKAESHRHQFAESRARRRDLSASRRAQAHRPEASPAWINRPRSFPEPPARPSCCCPARSAPLAKGPASIIMGWRSAR